ncbi:MAG: hypothetical protein ABJC62_10460 [Frankiaceae bacterium]
MTSSNGTARQPHLPGSDGDLVLASIVRVVLAVDPQADPDVVALAMARVAPKAHRRAVLVAELSAHPEFLTWGTTRSRAVTQAFIRELVAGGVRRVALPGCEWCGSTAPMVRRLSSNGGGACRACVRQMTMTACSRCRQVAPRGGRTGAGKPLCERCAGQARRARCPECGGKSTLCRRREHGAVRCTRCVPSAAVDPCIPCATPRPTRARRSGVPRVKAVASCDRCGRTAPVQLRLGDEALCSSCYCLPQRLCPCCGHPRPHQPDDTGDGACPRCGGAGSERCHICDGTIFALVRTADGSRRCERCRLRTLLRTTLTRPDGLVDQRLAGFVSVLGDAASPRTAIAWLRAGRSRDLLIAIAHGQLPLTHEALDEQAGRLKGAANAVEHLRQLLVTSRALPHRDEHASRLERTLTALLDSAHPDDAKVLRRYARFCVLPRLRRRTAAGAETVGVCHAATNTLRITWRFLRWLREHDTDLHHLTQAVLDRWSAGHPGSVPTVAVFLRWAARNRLTGQATLNDTRRWGPTAFLPAEQHWQLARRFLHDNHLPGTHRLLGCLVLLYSQPTRRLTVLRRSDVIVTGTKTTIRLGDEAVVLPAPLDKVAADLAAGRVHDATVAGLAHSFPRADDWLFPGRRAGQPIGDKGLHRRLTNMGIPPRRARNTALLELAREVPPAILADLLGLTPETADKWRQLAGGNWSIYAPIAGRPTRNVG